MEYQTGILIVGYGLHVENKILPAIRDLGFPILGIVSSNNNIPYSLRYFKDLNEVKALFKPSHIFIATNPVKHLSIIYEATQISKKILVEKPIAIQNPSVLNSKKIKNLRVEVKEGMMYRYNFLNKYLEKRNNLFKDYKKIEIKFILPVDSFNNKKSFRNLDNFRDSVIYDIGCYVYDFIWNFKLSNKDLNINEILNFKNGHAKFISLKSIKNNENLLNIEFVYGKNYCNEINLISRYNINYSLKPFFYGRESQVEINLSKNDKKFIKFYENKNSFVKMIAEWYLNKRTHIQNEFSNFDRISFIQNSLNKLSQQWRSHV